MTEFHRIWDRLVAAVRRASADDAPVAPPGFAVRVSANWMAMRRQLAGSPVWEWLALRGLGVAVAIAILAVAAIWPTVTRQGGGEEVVQLIDPLPSEDVLP